ncbi:hypothetical protein FHU41_002126 [Psychromicrobium silvestre]|uniref:TnsA endonuclease N-terminal domain-containing protein n=1 Tax=Psychromicrobium silvestre TaxID=1645614 RepID=A0A7Y9LUK5_9MICC|nr:TnsA-like heteromeric transposase endonuclease subunit [Psychromicrobium silvestre]NYE95876.1 hypothetical protein [Psychromicrobium silvestre]
MVPTSSSVVQFEYRDSTGTAVGVSAAEVIGADILRGSPVRRPSSYVGQRHYPGIFWSATTRTQLLYESLLEESFLWVADFDSAITGIASQPFRLRGQFLGRMRSHVPDFLLQTVEGRFRVVDVKPEDKLDRPEVAEIFEWTSRVCASKGWEYQVFTGVRRIILRNIRLIGRYRTAGLFFDPPLVGVGAEDLAGLTVSEASGALEPFASVERSALSLVLERLWWGEVGVDLRVPLSGSSLLFEGESRGF